MPELDVELLAAALRRDSADLNLYAGVLSEHLADSLPPGAVRVGRRRSVAVGFPDLESKGPGSERGLSHD